ncbi:MAG: rhomboid family intramembrane serine protease [Candidatus Diapherotrites archaeon]|nr:rhomboid family intramembrane serine protease [Candidatus Diapherotrites archaeon]
MKKRRIPYSTLGIFVFTFLVYFILSGGQPYIHPISQLDPFGVSGKNLLASFTYIFIHIGFKHVLGNMLVFLFLGMLLERRIGSKHVLGVYLSSGILAGFLYALIKQHVWVIGASAAISGIILACFLVDFKKAVVILISTMIAIPVFVFPLTDRFLDMMQEEKREKVLRLAEQHEQLQKEIAQIEKQKQNATEEQKKEIEKEEIKIMYMINKTVEEQQREVKKEITLSKGRQTEAITPVSFEIHIIGALTSAIYLWFFKREVYTKIMRGLRGIVKL